MRSITRRQRSQDRFGRDAIDFECLSAARRSRNDAHTAFRDAEMLRDEFDQDEIGGIFDRWRRDADLDQAVVRSGQLRPRGARLYVDLDAYRQADHLILDFNVIDFPSTTNRPKP